MWRTMPRLQACTNARTMVWHRGSQRAGAVQVMTMVRDANRRVRVRVQVGLR